MWTLLIATANLEINEFARCTMFVKRQTSVHLHA
jgi:hypothetical protein